MSKDTILTGVLIDETTTFTVIEVCQKYHISKDLLVELVEQGLFDTDTTDIEHVVFNAPSLRRIEIAFRLHRDLEINLQGVALALELLDEIDQMRGELAILKRQL